MSVRATLSITVSPYLDGPLTLAPCTSVKELRESINALEKKVRTMTGILNKVHGTPTAKCKSRISAPTLPPR